MTQSGCKITISGDKMSAQLCVSSAVEVNVAQVHEELRSAGIRFGIKSEAVEEALNNRDSSVLIATGTPPQQGTDDTVQFLVAQHLLDSDVNMGIGENLQRKAEISSVEAEQPIAKLIAGTPGKPGTNIYGETVEPPPIARISLRALSGAELSDDETTVIAKITGRPHLDKAAKSYRFQVQPSYIHAGDVTLEVGHLSFQGDITVYGNVIDGTSINASGNIKINGNVVGAIVQAGQSVHISGNVIKSEISSGAERLYWQKVQPLLVKLSDQLNALLSVIEQLNKSGQLTQLPFPQLAQKVISLRFSEYKEQVQQLQTLLTQQTKKAPPPKGADELHALLSKLLPEKWTSLNFLQQLAEQVFALAATIGDMTETKADIFLAYTLNTQVQAADNITVEGQGCIHSTLVAGEQAHIKGRLRGGAVHAPKLIFAREVGSQAGAVTKLVTARSGRIKVDRAFENTVFVVGKSTRKITDTIGKTVASLDAEGLVQLLNRN